MRHQDKNLMQRNLRQFLQQGTSGLYDNQEETLQTVEKFMGLPIGSEFSQRGREDVQETGVKKGDYFEVVSATGSGKTRIIGTMAKAMDVPAFIITPRNILNKQARKEFCEDIGIPESEVAVYDSRQKVGERRRVLEGTPPPKFVITTYHSLPSLVKRHELDITNPNDKHYRPLVILDEVHEAQGKEAKKIINRLKNEVLVAGFTATDGGASHTLFDGQKPIYHLPISNAIKRGILCKRVRTGTIDVAIGEAWVDNFLKTPKGQEFKREDVERFARTPSVIEGSVIFHLTKVDKELGRLARLPTVFYTEGVDAARDGAEKYNEYAEKMGLSERAAYVSGAMGPEKYGPILEDFKKGKIQAIFNDKLLGMGFDAKNATVCYSLKLSNIPHVVEQQLGRVSRKQDEDYLEKYGLDKVALAINVRPKGTNPRLFGQVLGAASVEGPDYNPNPTPRASVKEIQPPHSIELPKDIEVHLDYQDMETIIAESNQAWEKANTREMPKGDWLSSVDLAERYVGGNQSFVPLIQRYANEKTQELIAQGKTPEDANTIVATEYVGLRNSGSKDSLCASPTAAKELEQKGVFITKASRVPARGDWLSGKDLSRRYIGGDVRHNELLQQYAEKKTQELLLEGKTPEEAAAIVMGNYVGLRVASGHEGISASPAVVAELEEQGVLRSRTFQAPAKELGWLSVKDLSGLYFGFYDKHVKLLQSYKDSKTQELIAQGQTPEEAEALVNANYVGLRKTKSREGLCISPLAQAELEEKGELRSDKDRAPPKQPEWLSPTNLKALYISDSKGHNPMLQRYEEAKIQEFIAQGKTPEEAASIVDTHYVGLRTSAGQQSFCVSPLGITELEQRGELRHRAEDVALKEPEWLTMQEIRALYVGVKDNALLQQYADEKAQLFIAQGNTPEEAASIVNTNYVGMRKVGRGQQSTCISPLAKTELEQKGTLYSKTERAPAKQDWMSVGDMQKRYVGGAIIFSQLLERCADTKLKELIEQGTAPEEASAIVARDYVGLRSSGKKDVICASPSVIAALEQSNEIKSLDKKAPPKGDWLSSKDLVDRYIGADKALMDLAAKYADRKTHELIEQGNSPEEAAAIVESDYFGLRSNPSECMCVSPLMIAWLEENNELRDIGTKAPQKEPDWLSNKEIVQIYGVGLNTTRIIQDFVNAKKQEFIIQGHNPETAEAMVAKEYVGMRTSGSQQGLCFSPSAIEEMKRHGLKPIISRNSNDGSNLDEVGADSTGASFADKVDKQQINRRDIGIGSDHLKRTGRTLGKDNEI